MSDLNSNPTGKNDLISVNFDKFTETTHIKFIEEMHFFASETGIQVAVGYEKTSEHEYFFINFLSNRDERVAVHNDENRLIHEKNEAHNIAHYFGVSDMQIVANEEVIKFSDSKIGEKIRIRSTLKTGFREDHLETPYQQLAEFFYHPKSIEKMLVSVNKCEMRFMSGTQYISLYDGFGEDVGKWIIRALYEIYKEVDRDFKIDSEYTKQIEKDLEEEKEENRKAEIQSKKNKFGYIVMALTAVGFFIAWLLE